MSPLAKIGLTVAGLAGLGVASVMVMRSRGSDAPRVPGELQPAGDGAYTMRVGNTSIILPESSWDNARDAGLDIYDVIDRTQPNAWPLLAAVAEDLGLSEIYITSLYRASGTGPHTHGRGVDIGYVRRHDEPLVLLRRNGGEPEVEPQLAMYLREALKDRGATQVLTPWWIFSKGTRDDPNTGAEGIDADHLSHLHITLETIA